MGWQNDPVVGEGDPEVDSRGRTIVEPNTLQRRAGIRRNRFKDENFAGNVGRGFLSFGEDVARETTGALAAGGASPNLANNLGLATGFTADVGATLLPVGPTGRATAEVARTVPYVGDDAARWVMGQALNAPSRALLNGEAARSIDTMLEQGIPATASGAAKLKIMIGKLREELAQAVAASPGAVVEKGPVYKELQSLLDELAPLGERGAEQQAAVLKAWEQFKNHPFARGENTPMSLEQALQVKRAFQQEADSAYGSLTRRPIDDRIDMATGSGMRQATEAAAPAIAPINKQMSEYINALELIEPRAANFAKNQIAGISLAGQSPEATLLMMADKNPWIKSAVAQVLYGGKLPSATARTGFVGTDTMLRE